MRIQYGTYALGPTHRGPTSWGPTGWGAYRLELPIVSMEIHSLHWGLHAGSLGAGGLQAGPYRLEVPMLDQMYSLHWGLHSGHRNYSLAARFFVHAARTVSGLTLVCARYLLVLLFHKPGLREEECFKVGWPSSSPGWFGWFSQFLSVVPLASGVQVPNPGSRFPVPSMVIDPLVFYHVLSQG